MTNGGEERPSVNILRHLCVSTPFGGHPEGNSSLSAAAGPDPRSKYCLFRTFWGFRLNFGAIPSALTSGSWDLFILTTLSELSSFGSISWSFLSTFLHLAELNLISVTQMHLSTPQFLMNLLLRVKCDRKLLKVVHDQSGQD